MAQQVRILLADDDEKERERLEGILGAQDFVVKTSRNGKLALFDAIEFHPHVIIINTSLPKMDGYEVLGHIRSNPLLQNIPVVVYTAQSGNARKAMDLGADDILFKPFTDKEFLRSVKTRLERYQKQNSAYPQKAHEVDTDVFASYYHEFNTLLHGILGGTNLLINSNGKYSQQQTQELLFSVLKSGLRLNHSLSNLLMLEEIKRADLNPQLITMFTNGLSEKGWKNKLTGELRHMALEMYNRPGDLEINLLDIAVRIKYEYLLRIFIEITDNALKFSRPGQKVEITGDVEGENYVITIKDNGKGFPPATLDEVSPYRQFSPKKYDHSGLGIGLYIAKRLVIFNFGEIAVVPNEGGGSIFTVNLPLLKFA
ncbi:MAG TPA: response regulator [Chitinophagaceae bacterium]|nr:response regulator [Chitinophagaceae bacterium]